MRALGTAGRHAVDVRNMILEPVRQRDEFVGGKQMLK
jgi:hypothetical protein